MSRFQAAASCAPPKANPVAARLILGLLFLVVASSFFVFVEPAPYEALVGLLAFGALAAGMTFDRTILPMIVLLLLWNIAGFAALVPFLHDTDAVTFMVVSLYLALTAVLFASLLNEDVARRLAVIRAAYVMAALAAALIGVADYLQILPGSEEAGGRMQSTFKDPNVFGPFLILPILFTVDALLRRGLTLPRLLVATILLAALFLSFSRGAWANFLLSMSIAIILMFATSRDLQFRGRLVVFMLLAVLAGFGLIAALLSFDAVGAMFQERASLLQSYDAGQSGRFGRQIEGFGALLDRPLGLGPLQFGALFGSDPHNVYLNAFLSYGWLGGFAYLSLILSTLSVGFCAVFVRTPWQPVLILVFAAFTGTAVEGIVIDTDHWRHFYLLLGLVWGLAAVTARERRAAVRYSNNKLERDDVSKRNHPVLAA